MDDRKRKIFNRRPTTAVVGIKIPNNPVLTSERVAELIPRIRDGDKEARDELITSNMRLVVLIAGMYRGRGFDIEDLIGYGTEGLIHAVDRFDPSYKTQFSTYASYYIKCYITKGARHHGGTIRIPNHIVSMIGKCFKHSKNQLILSGGKSWDVLDETCRDLGFSESQAELIKSAIKCRYHFIATGGDDSHGFKIDTSVESREDRENLEDLHSVSLPFDSGLATVDEEDDMACLGREMLAHMEKAPDVEKRAVTLRLGLDGNRSHTLQEVGTIMGCTKERVRQVVNRWAIRAAVSFDNDYMSNVENDFLNFVREAAVETMGIERASSKYTMSLVEARKIYAYVNEKSKRYCRTGVSKALKETGS